MATSLLDWIMDLMQNDNAREAFEANPQAAMASAGLTNICGADVADSVPFLLDHPSVKTVDGETFRPDSPDAGDQIRYIVNNYTYKDVDNFAAPSDNDNDNDNESESDVDVDNRNEVEVENEISDLPGDGGGGDPDIDQSDSEVEGDQTATSTETETETDNSTETDTEVEVETDDNTVGNRNVPGDENVVDSTVTEIDAEIEDIVGDDNVEGGLIAVNDVIDTDDIDIDVLSELVETDDILRDSPILNDSLNDSVKDLINGPLL